MKKEKESIRIGTIHNNRTKQYLLPCLKYYGSQFKERINKLVISFIGIGDVVVNLTQKDKDLSNCIFIMFNTHYIKSGNKVLVDTEKKLVPILEWFTNHESYKIDYPFDDIHKGNKHVLVLALPAKHSKTIKAFKEGKYSAMYLGEDILTYFKGKNDEIAVFNRHKSQKPVFIKKINKAFNTDIELKEYFNGKQLELDFPPTKKNDYL